MSGRTEKVAEHKGEFSTGNCEFEIECAAHDAEAQWINGGAAEFGKLNFDSGHGYWN